MITCQNCRNVLDTMPGMSGDFSCPYCGALIRIPPQAIPHAYTAPPPVAPPVTPPVIYDAQPVVNVNPYSSPRTTYTPRRRSSGAFAWTLCQIPIFFVLIVGGFFLSHMLLHRSYDRDIGFRVAVNTQKDREYIRLTRAGEHIDYQDVVSRILMHMAVTDAMLWGFIGTPVVWGIGFAIIQLRRRD